MNSAGLRFGLFILIHALIGAGTATTARTQPPGQTRSPGGRSLGELQAFYQQNCARCHGTDGSSRSPEGKRLAGSDFTKAARAFRDAPGPAADREIQAMARTILKGLFFGITMPGWKDELSPDEATRMVKEVLLQAERGRVIQPENEAH
ncbi:MAG: cytochrome c [Acidobacteria bacterium]|nr:cytochrome c [Acidobacteriota bacterium]MBI3487080.1 cytochrome c [Acidobacteriota bacterium]